MQEARLADRVPENAFWAKLAKDRTAWHPLHAHSADVAAVMGELFAPGAPLAVRMAAALRTDELHPRHRAMIVYLAALHDIGKTNHGFQERGREKPLVRRRGHVKVFLDSLTCKPLARALDELVAPLDLPRKDVRQLLAATIAHHGKPWDFGEDSRLHGLWLPTRGIPRDPAAEIRRLGALALRWSGLADASEGPPLHVTPEFTHLFAGALTLADWIGSTEDAFPLTPDADPETYWDTARTRAASACARIGVTARVLELAGEGAPLVRRIFPAVFGQEGREPTPLQERMASMPLPVPGSRVLVESETGSGKTEAALVLFARLRAAGRVGGLVFALPTRATATAMHRRILDSLPGVYGNQSPTVALAVGGTHPEASSAEPLLRSEPHLYDDDENEGNAAALALWASQSAKRFMAAEIVVGTLDQLLLAALPVRHAHLRLAALTRHLIVVDELHSFDRYMTSILARLLEMHTGHGGVALFMSATLSDAARRAYAAAGESTLAEAVARPYPSLSVSERGAPWRDEQVGSPSGATGKRVHWAACAEDAWIDRAAEAARSGARVLVIRNTVKGARAAVAAMREAGHTALLWKPRPGSSPAYHSRYAPPDRRALDTAVLEGYGRGGTGAGVILVATQVAEQSLDIDFDLLVTDLCPVDVLLQRVGRLWRHPERVSRGTCTDARARVVVPEAGLEPYLASGRGPNGWGTVYPNLGDLELTARLLGRTIEIPEENRALVEAVYHADSRDALWSRPEWSDYLTKAEGKVFSQEKHAEMAALPWDETYTACARQFSDAAEARIRTRLGDDRVRVSLSAPLRCRYAPDVCVDYVELPEDVWRAAGVGMESPAVAAEDGPSGGQCFRLGEYRLSYDDDGWSWTRAAERPALT